jgi:hypothetical protein
MKETVPMTKHIDPADDDDFETSKASSKKLLNALDAFHRLRESIETCDDPNGAAKTAADSLVQQVARRAFPFAAGRRRSR